jgi:MHS family proline/betaine transporter-like MFS transporter
MARDGTEDTTARGAAPAFGARDRRTVLLASLGGALEYYDFILYGVFAKPIAQAFFPGDDPLVGLIKTFVVFAVGYLVRPLGGAVLGRLGDRYGRRGVFLASLLVVSIATFAMGCLPGYATLGAAATVLMVGLRMLQGLFLGGELPGAAVYAVEAAPGRPGLACGIVFALVNSGVLLAALVNMGLNETLSPSAVVSWGWRVGFLAGGVLGFVAFLLRRGLDESPGFERVRETVSRRPFLDVLRAHPGKILVGVGVMAASAAFNGLLFAHMPAFFTGVLHYDPKRVALAQNLALAVGSTGLLVAAWAGDKIPRRWILRTGAVLLAVLAWPFYRAMADRSFDLTTALVLAGLVSALVNGTFAALVADLFPTRVRFTGLALVMNLSFSLFGGLAPLIATTLVERTHDPASPGVFLAACAALTVIASFATRRWEGRIAASD